MKKVEYLNLKTLKILDPVALATAYQEIYGADPWNEYKKCSHPECGMHWGIEEKQLLEEIGNTHCRLPVTDYWPLEGENGLRNMFLTLSKEPLFEAVVAYDFHLGKVIGFCWGYQINHEHLNNIFPPLDVQTCISLKLPNEKTFIYLSDIAVDAEYRGMGVARNLAMSFFNKNKDQKWMITRTKSGENPSVTNGWFRRLGFECLLPYNDNSFRELQFAKISNLIS